MALPEDDEGTQCLFCHETPASFGYEVVGELRRGDGRGFVMANDVVLTCETCVRLFEARETDRLLRRAGSGADDELDLDIRATLPALYASVGLPHRIVRHVYPREIAELREMGFEPLDFHTGLTDEVGTVWPTEHARALPDTRRDWRGDTRWYVRSPWPSLSVADVLRILWAAVEHDRNLNAAVRAGRIRDVLAWGENRAQTALAASGN
jgi:hypothetical protein